MTKPKDDDVKRYWVEHGRGRLTAIYEEKVDGLDDDAFEVVRAADHDRVVAELEKKLSLMEQKLAVTKRKTNEESSLVAAALKRARNHDEGEEMGIEFCKKHKVDFTGTICGECFLLFKSKAKKLDRVRRAIKSNKLSLIKKEAK